MLAILWFGYFRSIYVQWLSWVVIVVFVGYMVTFLMYRYLTAHITAHMAHEPSYMFLAAIHGTISLAAIVFACFVFVRAGVSFERNENYFQHHTLGTITLALLWPMALISGMLI
jgi:hypothetical protein